MHRHGYKGRKLGRERDQRRALLKGLADSLILNESIETTLPKAKELRPQVEKLITKAKKNTLHTRRQVISSLQTKEAASKLVDEIAPRIKRDSGYLRIERSRFRRGDNAEMAIISFVDDVSKPAETAKPAKKKSSSTKKTDDKKASKASGTDKPVKKDTKKATKPSAKKTGAEVATGTTGSTK